LVDESQFETGYPVVDRVKFNNFAAGLNIRVAADFCIGRNSLVSNPQKFLPLANVPLEAQALGNFESRDHATLDLLARFSGAYHRLSGIPFSPDRDEKQVVRAQRV
jgi:hypothetical protein